ncbi:site-specific DNA-methyltransferase [Thomasclavelia cocleata]|uniref:site-specific DNA-methyltransferase n=2 Tax=Thomasclavelia cocleata TaxID=69824 RepID=UPI002574288F|nr:site-specific DNA-methyltransferase [Thomasclavelia cocleata]
MEKKGKIMEKIDNKSLDIKKCNIEKLKELFPNVVTEGKINFDVLRTILGDEVDDSNEKYQFTWKGKNKAIKIAQTPSSTTFRPDKESSKYWDTTENLYIEGDNLEVLKQLQKTYFGKVKMIYIDPPYNTGSDFIYKDDFKDSIENYKNQTKQFMSSNPETNGRYHTDWLNMMYPRLLLSKNLLMKNGVIFISINDKEQSNLKKICDEIFGENSFITTIHVELSTTQGMKIKAAQNGNIVKNAEYILVYSKDGHKNIVSHLLYDSRPDYDEHYNKIIINDKLILLKDYVKSKIEKEFLNESLDGLYKKSKIFKKIIENNLNVIVADDKVTGLNIEDFECGKIYSIERNDKKYLIINNGKKLRQLLRLSESYGKCDDFKASFGLRKIRGDWWKEFYLDMGNVSKEGNMVFSNGKKPVRLIKQIIQMCTDENDIVLDFFSGSSTTAHAVIQLNKEDNKNRKFIMVQLPELCDGKSSEYKNICEIGKERIRYVGDEIKQEWLKENKGEGLFADEQKEFPFDIGFKVFKLDSTNIRPWDNENEMDEDTLFDSVDIFKEGRSKEDILYEIMLKYGIFDMPANEIDVNGKTMYRVGKRYMIVCLEDDITNEDIQAIANLSPKTVVFKESGFNNDNDKINAVYNLEKAGVEDIKCI